MQNKCKLPTETETDAYSLSVPPETQATLHSLLDALESMDRRTALELEWLDKSSAEDDLKNFVRRDILSRHQTRRMPLQDAVEELRAQYGTGFSGTSS
jgi:hypothetical protein